MTRPAILTDITAEQLRGALSYDSETGEFVWIGKWCKMSRDMLLGRRAGHLCANGYVTIGLGKHSYKAHRLAWLYVHGVWPPVFLDHIDGCRSNNRIANLREATQAQNARNQRAYKNSVSGLKGATYHPASGKWAARVRHLGKLTHLGLFPSKEEAHEAYMAAALRLHGEFARAA